jgi:opacity protein-like surface antigen
MVTGEPYAAGFGGGAIAQDKDVDFETSFDGGQVENLTLKDVEFDTGVVFGAKIGDFFEGSGIRGNWGMELELYYFGHDVDRQTVGTSGTFVNNPVTSREVPSSEIAVTSVAFNVLYRLHLGKGERFPNGRFHPYAGLGLGLFFAELESKPAFLDQAQVLRDTDTDTQFGVQAIAGTKLFLTRHIALFGEYKFIQTADFQFRLENSGTVSGTPVTETRDWEFDLTEHQIYVGVAYHF